MSSPPIIEQLDARISTGELGNFGARAVLSEISKCGDAYTTVDEVINRLGLRHLHDTVAPATIRIQLDQLFSLHPHQLQAALSGDITAAKFFKLSVAKMNAGKANPAVVDDVFCTIIHHQKDGTT